MYRLYEYDAPVEVKYISQATQRNAVYTTPAEGHPTYNAIEEFFTNGTATSPNIKYVCGIDCPDNTIGCEGEGNIGG